MFENVKKYVPLNWSLLANPVNWAIVILMLAIAALALAHIFPKTNSENKS